MVRGPIRMQAGELGPFAACPFVAVAVVLHPTTWTMCSGPLSSPGTAYSSVVLPIGQVGPCHVWPGTSRGRPTELTPAVAAGRAPMAPSQYLEIWATQSDARILV